MALGALILHPTANTLMLSRCLTILLLAWIALPCAAAEEPQRWALLIGVDDYTNFQDLRFCGHDASALAESLRRSGFDERCIYLLHDGATDARYKPFKANVEKQLDVVLNLAGPDDLVIVSFSGHGIHYDGKSYLCPSEADDTDSERTMIAVDDVYQKFSECRAALKLLLVDACRNDPRPPGRRSATPTKDRTSFGSAFERPPEGIVVLASCAPGQISWEDEGLKHGVFMSNVLKALSGEADGNRNGRVTLGELYDFASAETKLFVANRFGEVQVPAQRGEINGIFELPLSARPKEIRSSLGMRLKLIPAGEFFMGSPPGETGRVNIEIQHRVKITRPLYMQSHEVTRRQFAEFVKAENYVTEAEKAMGGWGYDAVTNQFVGPDVKYDWRNTGFAQTDDDPVVNVTWADAVAFCRYLTRKDGRIYRLPTEAEWEYACRAGTQTTYENGDDPNALIEVANIADQTFKTKKPGGLSDGIDGFDGFIFTAPVGRFRPNAFGLHDMTGNAIEWCADWYDGLYYRNSPVNDPAGPNDGERRIIRGGSWVFQAALCRPAFRHAEPPSNANCFTGFRVVVEP